MLALRFGEERTLRIGVSVRSAQWLTKRTTSSRKSGEAHEPVRVPQVLFLAGYALRGVRRQPRSFVGACPGAIRWFCGVETVDRRFALQGRGTILEELSLPLVEKGWLDLVLVAEVCDADEINQVTPKDGDLLISRIVFAGLWHETDSIRFVV